LLKVLIEETEKEKQQDKTIINQLSKTMADNSKVLSEFGLTPPFVSKIKNMISMNYIIIMKITWLKKKSLEH
jgi:hypothetical protein